MGTLYIRVRHGMVASTGMDETNGSVDCGQVEMSALDHPRSEPHDLPGWKGLLHHEPADYGIADVHR